jgi:hypothetical protein
MEEQAEAMRRRVLDSAISNICLIGGFARAEAAAIETLSEMLVNCKLKN